MSIFNKSGIVKIDSVNEVLQLSDGSKWLPIVNHNIKNGTNLFSTSDDFTKFVYHNVECWANFPMIAEAHRPNTNYEFLVLQQNPTTDKIITYRWAQTVSPLTATWEDVSPSSGNITHYDGTSSYGGMYILNGSVYMCFANSSKGKWFGCAHNRIWQGTVGTNGAVPGYNGSGVSGTQLVYIRIAKDDASIRSNVSVIDEFYEI